MEKYIFLILLLSFIIPMTSCVSSGNTQPDETVEEEITPINYSFHETIEILPNGTNGTAGKNATYIYFGDWPQTIKANDKIINEEEKEIHGAFTYYKGNDGYWYAKCIEKKYEWKTEGLTYSDGSPVEEKIKYFKVEPIKWCILTENYNNSNKALLLSEKILIGQNYIDGGTYRIIDGKEIYPSNYKESRIRAYLNGISYTTIDTTKQNPEQIINSEFENNGFLHTAFTNNAQSLIAVSTIDNSYVSNIHYPAERNGPWNTGRDDYWCEDTYDKVFLLSEKEVTSGDFKFGTLTETSIKDVKFIDTTDFAKANNVYEYYLWDKFVSFWWLRTPMNGDWRLNRFVDYQGCSADNMGGNGGIVPAICVSLNK